MSNQLRASRRLVKLATDGTEPLANFARAAVIYDELASSEKNLRDSAYFYSRAAFCYSVISTLSAKSDFEYNSSEAALKYAIAASKYFEYSKVRQRTEGVLAAVDTLEIAGNTYYESGVFASLDSNPLSASSFANSAGCFIRAACYLRALDLLYFDSDHQTTIFDLLRLSRRSLERVDRIGAVRESKISFKDRFDKALEDGSFEDLFVMAIRELTFSVV